MPEISRFYFLCFSEAVRLTHKNASDQEIGKYIGFALASAADRDGGRKSRPGVGSDQSIL